MAFSGWWLCVPVIALLAAFGFRQWYCRRREYRDRALVAHRHFVRGFVFAGEHRRRFPGSVYRLDLAFDPEHGEERNRLLAEWGYLHEAEWWEDNYRLAKLLLDLLFDADGAPRPRPADDPGDADRGTKAG